MGDGASDGQDQGAHDPPALSARAQRLIDLLAAHPDGLSNAALLAAARQTTPTVSGAALTAALREAGDAVSFDGNIWTSTAPAAGTPAAVPAFPHAGTRIVVIDIEATPRPCAEPPYTERHTWQIGAVRTGTDSAWIAAQPELCVYVDVPAEVAVPARARAAHTAGALSRASAAVAVADYCSNTDMIGTWHGRGVDLPELEALFAETGVTEPAGDRIDIAYLAYCCWPLATSHELTALAAAAGVNTSGFTAHDARDDAALASTVLAVAATHIAGWDDELLEIIAAAATTSPIWSAVFDMGRTPFTSAVLDEADVTTDLAGLLGTRPPVRAITTAPTFSVPAAWKDTAGRVDPHHLALVGHPGSVRRAAQTAMAVAIADAIDAGDDIAIEAATGTGKSLAALAAALDWIDGRPDRVAVIATHTKQLQRQLAGDVETLAGAAPGLAAAATIIKGASNRLSARALIAHLVDASQRTGPADSATTLQDELVIYLLCRFLATPSGLIEEWEVRSVDDADLPVFFDDYTAQRSSMWATALSQHTAGDFKAANTVMGPHTRLVREHINAGRIIIANHALVLAHTDDLPTGCMLIADEAHTLEDAATGSIAASFEVTALEIVAARLRRLSRNVTLDGPAKSATEHLQAALARAVLHRTAQFEIDKLCGPRQGGRLRTSTIASPYTGAQQVGPAVRLGGELRRIVTATGAARKTLAGWLTANQSTLPPTIVQQTDDIVDRLANLHEEGSRIIDDLVVLNILPPSPGTAPAPPPTTGPGGAATGTTPASSQPATSQTPAITAATANSSTAPSQPNTTSSDEIAFDDLEEDTADGNDGVDDDVDDDAGPTDADDTTAGAPPAAAPMPVAGLLPVGNRVIWFAEEPALDHTPRGYRFSITSSPIRVGREPDWKTLWVSTEAVVLTSATLTVAAKFDHLIDRLSLDQTPRIVQTEVITGSFDYRNQSKLVCFDDFPSWAEHAAAAQRLVAHQLTGWAAETETYGKRAPGAMVLTTSKAAAATISEHLATELGRNGVAAPLQPAVVWGNRRSIDSFNNDGGILVGTKGLWAGVDVKDPGRCQIVWINKLPFAPFADPVIAARRAEVEARATATGIADPQAHATEHYYLPLAAIELRQAVGRLLRTDNHYGVIIISDRKLAGVTRQRRLYRQLLLGSLDPGLLDNAGTDIGAGNVMSMAHGWSQIWPFLAARNDIDPARLPALCSPDQLRSLTMLPSARVIAEAELSAADEAAFAAAGTLETEVLERCARVAGALRFSDQPAVLKAEQKTAISAAVRGDDLCALLPTGFGKSWCFQLPALVLPGVTIVVSPLVALMTDQVLDLNPVLGDRVRALVSMMPESMSRAGRAELAAELTGDAARGIKLVYVSPERFAQASFRSWIDDAVTAGRVRRIVFDEAHTAVTWGDDFRPSYRRLTEHLATLTAAASNAGLHLAISAFTATANRTVREGLRTRLFRLPVTVPIAGDRGNFTMVSAQPIRPELAIYRRRLAGGHITRATLLESVVNVIDEHSIIYCTTVRDVEATWAHLVDYLGPARASSIRRFHGRLPDAEKQAVLTDFKDAPAKETADGAFQPLIVVATSAFGLGVNRNDIRNVICLTPPTDLAALYQQLGRAGRDRHGSIPGTGDTASVGVAIATGRGFRTVEFLTQDIPRPLLRDAARRVLAAAVAGCVDPGALAADLVATELAAGRIDVFEARRKATLERYRTVIMRALATLVAGGTLEDRGDHPSAVRLGPADVAPTGAFAAAVTAIAQAGPTVLPIDDLRSLLAAAGHPSPDASELWASLVALFNAGVADVSVASPTWRTSVAFIGGPVTTPSASFEAMADQRAQRTRSELTQMRAWFDENRRCANEGLADYFASTLPATLPAGVCSTPECRCLNCWGTNGTGAAPRLHDALLHPMSKPAGSHAAREQALDRAIATLLYDQPRGIGPRMLWCVLRGEETRWDVASQRRVSLPRALLYHQLFNSKPGLRDAAVTASLTRIQTAGIADLDGHVWRHRHWIDLDAVRNAAAATSAGATTP